MERGGVRWVSDGEWNSIDASEAFGESRLLDSLEEGVHNDAWDRSAVLGRRLWVRQAVANHVEAQLLWHIDANAAKGLQQRSGEEREGKGSAPRR
jgi:hypothetical protein